MKNLKLYKCEFKTIPISDSVIKFAQSSENSSELYLYHNLKISKYDTQTSQISTIFNVSDEIPTAKENDAINLIFLPIQRSLCLILTSGEILLIDVDSSPVHTECKYFLPGIKAAEMSSDQDLLVVVLNDAKVILLNYSLDLVNSANLWDETFGEREFITVGWGKKETQFHGSEGKEAAKSKLQSHPDILNSQTDKYIITWRGDGTYFVVGFEYNFQTLFKVFNREGLLQYTSEKQPGLECNFAWRPSGNLIATTQVFPNKYVVAFFEKNGLKHGEFVLPFKYDDVLIINLSWSSDSEALCVHYIEKSTQKTNLIIYTTGNYHWYLKQSLSFNADSKITALSWEDTNSESTKSLKIFLDTHNFARYDWIWSIDRSAGKNKDDDAVVGVVDGNKILLTDFRNCIVPPPMSSIALECEKNVNRVIFGPTVLEDCEDTLINSNCLCAQMENSLLSFYTKEEKKKYKLISTFCLSTIINDVLLISDILWLSKTTMMCLNCQGSTTDLLVLNISYKPVFKMSLLLKVSIQERIIGLKSAYEQGDVLLQSDTGHLKMFNIANGLTDFPIKFPECCYQFDVASIDGEYVLFGLTGRNRFYINNAKIANNINSYFIHSDFLLLTTLQHQLLSCPLNKIEIEMLQNNEKADSYGKENQDTVFTNRNIERGSSLIMVVSCDNRTVMQLPRGNLEVIQPRALSLKIIGNYLDNYEYKIAFDLMRKQRVNLNLIHDHNPTKFLEHIDEFISKTDNPSWLSLFISELDEQDVTNTMYSSSYKNDKKATTARKIKTVCEKTRICLETVNQGNKYLLPILTTFVKINTLKDLENALSRIKNVRKEETVTNSKSLVSANDALKYLLYLVNVDELYNVALGMYDFDLVMFVANKSQKDPKEYIPYLNNLKNMEENYRRFSIDNDLKKYESALKYLIISESVKEGEILSFVKQHCLYNCALQLISVDKPEYGVIANEYANYLMLRRHFIEAGTMYRRSLNYTKAIECFTEALEWQSAILVAEEQGLSEEELNTIKRKLLHKLKESGSYTEAMLLLQSSSDIKEKISCALDGKLFKQALFICQSEKLSTDDLIKPAILEQYTMLMSLIEQNQSQYIQQRDRLFIVRQNKINTNKQNENNENLPIDCDLYSDTSSIMGSTNTKSSGRTYRSGKNRRKHERKLVSLKEGSRFEDVALIRALHVLITNTFNLRHDVCEINYLLRWFGRDEDAVNLQNMLDNILNEMNKELKDIWTPELTINACIASQNFNKCTDINIENASVTLDPHIRIAPVIQEYKWKINQI